ncbi:uncharacterized protein LOC134811997 [Bolinopsis microptera]|uniref:uncharacterized protein LOC134811997 n=1 Tax=Bolinopsis microptera TaxID=2820187 RepID=UPI0030797183
MCNQDILYHEQNISAVTSTHKDITTAVDQTLTCSIGGLDASGTPATVTWKDNTGTEVDESDTSNYGLEQGSVNGSGNQVAVLTIKAAKLAAFASLSSVTYKCSVKSSQYTNSPASADLNVEADILKLVLTAVNKEQLTGTEATISCTVTGLTQAFSAVKWTTSANDDALTQDQGYTVEAGSLVGKSQTTTLTIPVSENNGDVTYSCVFTSAEHASVDQKTAVSSKVFTVTSTRKNINTAVDQTLTCNIGGLDASGTPATVTWKDNAGAEVETSDTSNYGLEQGSVDGSGNQVAVLTIKTAKLAAFASPSSVTYKCSVKSSQYTNSPASEEVDVIADILKLEFESVNKEVKKGSDTTISCVITGLTETATVTWRTSTGPVTAEKFTSVQGSHSGGKQTSTLAVDGTLVNEDTAYTCRVTSD